MTTGHVIAPLAGVPHILERVKVADLQAWLAERHLMITGKATLTGDGLDFPPILVARRER